MGNRALAHCREDALDATSAESGGSHMSTFSGDISGKRIGIPKEYFSEALDVSVRAVAERAIEQFSSLGAEIVPMSLPSSYMALPALLYYYAGRGKFQILPDLTAYATDFP